MELRTVAIAGLLFVGMFIVSPLLLLASLVCMVIFRDIGGARVPFCFMWELCFGHDKHLTQLKALCTQLSASWPHSELAAAILQATSFNEAISIPDAGHGSIFHEIMAHGDVKMRSAALSLLQTLPRQDRAQLLLRQNGSAQTLLYCLCNKNEKLELEIVEQVTSLLTSLPADRVQELFCTPTIHGDCLLHSLFRHMEDREALQFLKDLPSLMGKNFCTVLLCRDNLRCTIFHHCFLHASREMRLQGVKLLKIFVDRYNSNKQLRDSSNEQLRDVFLGENSLSKMVASIYIEDSDDEIAQQILAILQKLPQEIRQTTDQLLANQLPRPQ
jgi:hypothetical protein